MRSTTSSSSHKEKKTGTGKRTKKFNPIFSGWKALIPALAMLGVGGYYMRGRQARKNNGEDWSN